jgi:hypothetical protein
MCRRCLSQRSPDRLNGLVHQGLVHVAVCISQRREVEVSEQGHAPLPQHLLGDLLDTSTVMGVEPFAEEVPLGLCLAQPFPGVSVTSLVSALGLRLLACFGLGLLLLGLADVVVAHAPCLPSCSYSNAIRVPRDRSSIDSNEVPTCRASAALRNSATAKDAIT